MQCCLLQRQCQDEFQSLDTIGFLLQIDTSCQHSSSSAFHLELHVNSKWSTTGLALSILNFCSGFSVYTCWPIQILPFSCSWMILPLRKYSVILQDPSYQNVHTLLPSYLCSFWLTESHRRTLIWYWRFLLVSLCQEHLIILVDYYALLAVLMHTIIITNVLVLDWIQRVFWLGWT